jgi:dihydroxyacetone kinase
VGDKTLLDSLVPAVDTLERELQAGRPAAEALAAATTTAQEAAEATKGMLAQRGRAAYSGERSRDSVDAGAVGIAVMFDAVTRAWSPTSV